MFHCLMGAQKLPHCWEASNTSYEGYFKELPAKMEILYVIFNLAVHCSPLGSPSTYQWVPHSPITCPGKTDLIYFRKGKTSGTCKCFIGNSNVQKQLRKLFQNIYH